MPCKGYGTEGRSAGGVGEDPKPTSAEHKASHPSSCVTLIPRFRDYVEAAQIPLLSLRCPASDLRADVQDLPPQGSEMIKLSSARLAAGTRSQSQQTISTAPRMTSEHAVDGMDDKDFTQVRGLSAWVGDFGVFCSLQLVKELRWSHCEGMRGQFCSSEGQALWGPWDGCR